MDFGDTPEEAAFRAEAHAFLARHARLREPAEESVSFLADTDPDVEAAHIAAAKAWQATLYREGWAGVTWPKENGGRGGSMVEALVFAQEEARFDVPSSIFAQGIGMAGPTLIAHEVALPAHDPDAGEAEDEGRWAANRWRIAARTRVQSTFRVRFRTYPAGFRTRFDLGESLANRPVDRCPATVSGWVGRPDGSGGCG